MDREDIAYLINTTPKYFYMLKLHITLLKRYAKHLTWPVYIATEEPVNYYIQEIQKLFPDVQIIPLTQEQEGFLDSRAVASAALPEEIQYVFPIQEDFLLEARPLWKVFEHACSLLDRFPDVHSLRMMPCPAPRGKKVFMNTDWKILQFGLDDYLFTYQATLWRRSSYQEYMNRLCAYLNSMNLSQKEKNKMAIDNNIAEVKFGQEVLVGMDEEALHLAWPREGEHPNAVYLAPWPYRPTAVVRGKLMEWAVDLASRERVELSAGPSLR
jgi:hypothetical protein